MRSKLLFCLITLFFVCNAFSQNISTGNLMPVPKKMDVKDGHLMLNKDFSVAIHAPSTDTILLNAVNRFVQTLNRKTSLYFVNKEVSFKDKSDTAVLQIFVNKKVIPSPAIDESYSLSIEGLKMMLKAPTTPGAMHGLQTIIQLLSKNNDGLFYFPDVAIEDAPRFAWRGLLIDVARHFIPLDVIKRNIDAMEAVKMNVLHLHLSDNEGFRMESKIFPQLQDKGSNGEYFTQAEMKELIAFAKDRGIMIVPEFDMPGHSKSWFAGYPQLSASKDTSKAAMPIDFNKLGKLDIAKVMEYASKIPMPAMDPSKESTYDFLDKFIGEMSAIFPSAYFHIGADENNGVVWKNNPSIVAFMKSKKLNTTHELQDYFVERVHGLVVKHHKKMIAWEEAFSPKISKDVTLQVWQNPTYIKKGIDHGNDVLISQGFYIDWFYPAYIHYNNPSLPSGKNDSLSSKIKGGEAAQWTELADRRNIETRIWPRAAAVAERLWSPASVTDVDDMYRRLFALNEQLDEQGLQNISDYERGLRSISNDNFNSLKTFTDALRPVPGLKKLFAQLARPQSLTYPPDPLGQVSDIIPVDSKVKWIFRNAVKSYLVNKDSASEKTILYYLNLWKANDSNLTSAFATSSSLKAVEPLSKSLSEIAAVGLDAMNEIRKGAQFDGNQMEQKLDVLKNAAQSYGQAEICIIPEIESLIRQKLEPLPASYPMF